MLKKLTNAYKNMHPAAKASLWLLICGFLQKGISMLTTPIFTRVMTDGEYGRYAVYNSWLGIIQIVVSMNLAAGVYTRGLVKNEEDQDRFSSSMLGLSTTLILLWSLVYAVFHKTINNWLGLSTMLMAAMLVEIWAHAAYQFWSNRERVNFRYKKLVALTVAYVVLQPLLGVFCVLQADQHHQMEARALAMVLVNVVLFTALYVSITRKGKQFYSKKYWLYALKFNIPLVPHYLSQVVLNQSDRLMINRLCSAAETAYYSVAYTLAMVLQILNNSIAGTMNPWIYKSLKAGEHKKIGSVSGWILALIAAMNLMIVLCAPEILSILAPESYRAAVWVIPPVVVSIYFSFLYNLFATIEFYYEKTHYVTIASVIGAMLNIVLNAIFIPVFGFVAAGYTTLVCYILYAVAHYLFMKKVTRQFMDGAVIYNLKSILVIGTVLLVGSLLVMLLYNTVLIRYGLLLVLVGLVVWKRKLLIDTLKAMKKKDDSL